MSSLLEKDWKIGRFPGCGTLYVNVGEGRDAQTIARIWEGLHPGIDDILAANAISNLPRLLRLAKKILPLLESGGHKYMTAAKELKTIIQYTHKSTLD